MVVATCLACCEEGGAGEMLGCSEPACEGSLCRECTVKHWCSPGTCELVCPSKRHAVTMTSALALLGEEAMKPVIRAVAEKRFEEQRAKLPVVAKLMEVEDEVQAHKLDLEEYESQISHYTKLRAIKRRKIDDLMWKRREITDTTSFVSQGCPWDGCNGVVACDPSAESCVIKPCRSCERLVCFRCAAAIDGVASHVCDEKDLQSARAIEKECTKCPGCSAAVYKINGCNHMFCTNCNTSFNNSTGKRISHSFGNVHFHEWVRSLSESERREVMMDIERQQARGDAFIGFDPLFGVWMFTKEVPVDVRGLCTALNTLISHTARHRQDRGSVKSEAYYGMKNRQYLKNELDKEKYIQQIQRHLRVDMCIQEANGVVSDLVDAVREAIGRHRDTGPEANMSHLMRTDIAIELNAACCEAAIEAYRVACSRMAKICSVASRPSLKQKVALDRFVVTSEARALYCDIVHNAGLFRRSD